MKKAVTKATERSHNGFLSLWRLSFLKRKGQIATEYLVIIGIAIALVIPVVIVYVNYSSQGNDEILISKVDSITDELSMAINTIYSYGEDSETSLLIKFPKGVEKLEFINNEVILSIKMSNGQTNDIVKVVGAVMVPCSIPEPSPGTHKITLKKIYNPGSKSEMVSFKIDDREC